MTQNKNTFVCITVVGILGCLTTSAFATPLQILEFKKTQLSQTEQRQICEQAKDFCQDQAPWRSLKTPDQNLWLLSGGAIAQFHPAPTGLKLARQWQIDVAKQQRGIPESRFIFPKLFPMTQQRYAIAVVDAVSEMYSGGGANIERASFYELKDSGKIQQFIDHYPFSFSRMIRACFSSEDYEHSKGKCHDEDGLSLDIRPLKPMLWQFRYRYRLNISPASDSNEKSYQGSRNLNIDLNKVPKYPNIPVTWNDTGQE